MATEKKKELQSVFSVLQNIDCSSFTKEKNGFTYLSWVHAWGLMLENYPDAQYKVYENETIGLPYFSDGKTAMVKVGVIVNGRELIEWYPVMDFKNKAIPLENITTMEVNKAIQRALTKCCAKHGLGLSIYAGEDLPMDLEDYSQLTPEEAVEFINKSTGTDDLKKRWAKLKKHFGQNKLVLKAVRENEYNDKAGRSNDTTKA